MPAIAQDGFSGCVSGVHKARSSRKQIRIDLGRGDSRLSGPLWEGRFGAVPRVGGSRAVGGEAPLRVPAFVD